MHTNQSGILTCPLCFRIFRKKVGLDRHFVYCAEIAEKNQEQEQAFSELSEQLSEPLTEPLSEPLPEPLSEQLVSGVLWKEPLPSTTERLGRAESPAQPLDLVGRSRRYTPGSRSNSTAEPDQSVPAPALQADETPRSPSSTVPEDDNSNRGLDPTLPSSEREPENFYNAEAFSLKEESGPGSIEPAVLEEGRDDGNEGKPIMLEVQERLEQQGLEQEGLEQEGLEPEGLEQEDGTLEQEGLEETEHMDQQAEDLSFEAPIILSGLEAESALANLQNKVNTEQQQQQQQQLYPTQFCQVGTCLFVRFKTF